MAYISLNPAPTIFDKATTVRVTQDSRVSTVVYSTDGSAPTLAKNIAYDTLTPSNPFISVVQDGKGNCVFDGGFPKWYNTRFNAAWSSFNDMSNTFKYFVNVLDFIANPDKPKKVLFIGDRPANSDGSFPDYHVKDDTRSAGFKKSIVGTCRIAGYDHTIISPEDYANNMIELSYSFLNQFCSVVIFGSLHTGSQRTISSGTINNLIAFREAGHGILIVTDHGDDQGTSGFFYNVNFLARELGAEFRGNYDRTPVNVGYLIDNYGNHPLWKNMSRSEDVYAGGSESRVVITEYPQYSKAPDVSISKNGWTTIRYLVQLSDGSIELENYTYGLNVNEFVFFPVVKKTVLNNELIDYNVEFPEGHDAEQIRGIVRHNSDVLGEFTRTRSSLNKQWLNPDGRRIRPRERDTIEVAVTDPFTYFKSTRVGRIQPPVDSVSLPRLIKDVSVLELSVHEQKNFIKSFHETLGISNVVGIGRKMKLLRDYINS